MGDRIRGALDPQIWGAPFLPPICGENACFNGVWGTFGVKMGRPKFSGKKKAHKHKLFCPVGLGTTPGLSRGFHRVCPWDKSGENLGHTRVFSLFYTVEARFHRVCPWDKPDNPKGGTESLCACFAR